LKPSRTFKEPTLTAISQNRKPGSGVTKENPLSPYLYKITSLQYIKDEIPIDMVVSFFQIQFTKNTWNPGL